MQSRLMLIVRTELVATTTRGVIVELVAAAASSPLVRHAGALLTVVLRRERSESTALGNGVAVPHALTAAVTDLVLVFGRSRRGVRFSAPDQHPVHLFFLLAVPGQQANRYLRLLGAITRLVSRQAMRERLLTLSTPSALARFLRQHLT